MGSELPPPVPLTPPPHPHHAWASTARKLLHFSIGFLAGMMTVFAVIGLRHGLQALDLSTSVPDRWAWPWVLLAVIYLVLAGYRMAALGFVLGVGAAFGLLFLVLFVYFYLIPSTIHHACSEPRFVPVASSGCPITAPGGEAIYSCTLVASIRL